MKHYGDVKTLNGAELSPVDIITFGSPCQNLSIAGNRSGITGSQSSLFFEAIRIIREMRCKTNGQSPRWICWENVPGAFSSNSGADFKAVLDSIIGIVEPTAQVPLPDKNRWPHADCYLGCGWSLAYRTLDAQHWGVPQRRRRIFLVADFAGGSAGKILFKSEGLSGYSAAGFRAWQRASSSLADCIGDAIPLCLNDQGGSCISVSAGVTSTLRAQEHGHQPCVLYENHSQDSRYTGPLAVAPTVATKFGTGGNNQPLVISDAVPHTLKMRSGRQDGDREPLVQSNLSAILSCNDDQTFFAPTGGLVPYAIGNGQLHQADLSEKAGTLTCMHDQQSVMVPQGNDQDAQSTATPRYTIRRLTPMECGRLQGFPDWWCKGLETPHPTEIEICFWSGVWETHRNVTAPQTKPKSRQQIVKWLKAPHTDSAEYRMWGNGVALPCVFFVLSGIVWASSVVSNC